MYKPRPPTYLPHISHLVLLHVIDHMVNQYDILQNAHKIQVILDYILVKGIRNLGRLEGKIISHHLSHGKANSIHLSFLISVARNTFARSSAGAYCSLF